MNVSGLIRLKRKIRPYPLNPSNPRSHQRQRANTSHKKNPSSFLSKSAKIRVPSKKIAPATCDSPHQKQITISHLNNTTFQKHPSLPNKHRRSHHLPFQKSIPTQRFIIKYNLISLKNLIPPAIPNL